VLTTAGLSRASPLRSALGAMAIGLTVTGMLAVLDIEIAIEHARVEFQRHAAVVAERARLRSQDGIEIVRDIAALYTASDSVNAEELERFRRAVGNDYPYVLRGFVADRRFAGPDAELVIWGEPADDFTRGMLEGLRQRCTTDTSASGVSAEMVADAATGSRYAALSAPVAGGRQRGCAVVVLRSGIGVAQVFAGPEAKGLRGFLFVGDDPDQAPWSCYLGGEGRVTCPLDPPSRRKVTESARIYWAAEHPLVAVAGSPRLVILPANPRSWVGFADSLTWMILVAGLAMTAFAVRLRGAIARSRAEISRRERVYRALIADLPIAFIGWDGTGSIVEWNPAAERLFGWSSGDALGQPVERFLAATPTGTPLRLMPSERTAPADFEGIELARADGTSFSANLLLHTMRERGGWRCSAFVRDISEQKREHQDLLKAARMVGAAELASGFAHDFNNALAVVIGSLELLAPAVGDDPEANEDLSAARDAARRGADLVGRMLAMVRARTPVDDEVAIDEAMAQLLPEMKRVAGALVVVSATLAAPAARVRVDRAWLQSALLNLVLNAKHAMPNGGTLSLSTRRGLHPEVAPGATIRRGEFVAVEVSDTGHGMAPEVAARAFEIFFTTKPEGIGTGLGLAMVRAFARQRGGDAVLESTPGAGTTVRIFLPLVNLA
jgi:PAS domain S-box-containing protein